MGTDAETIGKSACRRRKVSRRPQDSHGKCGISPAGPKKAMKFKTTPLFLPGPLFQEEWKEPTCREKEPARGHENWAVTAPRLKDDVGPRVEHHS